MPFSRLVAGLLLAGPLLTGALPAGAQPAGAQPVSSSPAEQAAATQDALRQWIAGLLGPRLDPASHQPRVTAESDALRVELPVAGPLAGTGWTVEASPVTARIKPMEDGRWAISSFAWPSPIQAQGPLPESEPAPAAHRARPNPSPSARHPGAGSAEPRGPAMGQWLMRLGEQKLEGVLDPSLRTASTFDVVIGNEAVHFSSRGSEQTTRIGRLTARYGWEPTGDEKVRMFWRASHEDYRVAVTAPQSTPVAFSAARIDDDGTIDGVAFTKAATVVRGLAEVAGAVSSGTKGDLPPDQRALLQRAVAALPDLFDRFHEAGTASSITFEAGGLQASLAALGFEAAGEASGEGLARVSERLTARGFDSPAIPPEMRGLVPHQVVMAIRVDGLPGREVSSMLTHALNEDATPLGPDDFAALLGRGPLAVGLDELGFDLGPASVTAEGEMRIPSPQDVAGTLHVRATGLDALMVRAQKTPSLAQMVPALALLKGFGRPQGEALVWDITYAKGRTTVNGTDLTALLGGGGTPRGGQPRQEHP